ncbi:MAG: Rossmann-like and DUF2520 domain-containing protein [Betaproteobacteria bacterium]
MQNLNIIGAGRVGRTLGALWRRAGVFAIRDVVSRSADSAQIAVRFIGEGNPFAAMENLRVAETWMLTVPDDRIADCARTLAKSGVLRAEDIVFHCSGALSSAELAPAAECGARVASVHPVKSFAEPHMALSSFAGTWCAGEGDAAALAVLQPAFERIGAHFTRIEAAGKLLYHAGSVIGSNYLVALMEASLQCYERAGMSRDDAITLMTPLVRETLENILHRGTVDALTGPIARGDHALVARQLGALQQSDPGLATLYRRLGAVALRLAREKGEASPETLDAIEKVLAS